MLSGAKQLLDIPSPTEAVKIATGSPKKTVVFFVADFETICTPSCQ